MTTASPGAPTGVPRSRKGAQTRARLLAAARTVFERTGFLDSRVSDIADEAGMSHGSFYHYFESKEQVFRELAESLETLLTAPPEDDQADDDTPTDGSEYGRLVRANRRYLRRYRDNAEIMGVIEEVSRYDDQVRDARIARQKHFADRAERSIRRLQQDGLADPDIDPGIAALALGSMVARTAEAWLTEGWDDHDFDTMVDQLSRLWANAIGLAEARPG